jgi:mono/diheme cytochrome c family protein
MNAMRSLPVLLLCAALSGCDRPSRRGFEYAPDMARSVPYDTFAPNPVTRDGLTQQRPVRGTIPRGFRPVHFAATTADAERAGRELASPLAPTPSVIGRGKESYETFCLVCHGAHGDGDGPIAPLIPGPPPYSSDRVRVIPEGRLFHVITFGSGRMPSYASQVPADERWAIVAYVRTLQHREEASR